MIFYLFMSITYCDVLFLFQVLLLLAKTNNDWWSVRQLSGKEGYVPANYVKVCEPKVRWRPTGEGVG